MGKIFPEDRAPLIQTNRNRGGMRGIVELEVLQAIERELPAGIPIRSFFDLIIGTSTGGIIALGLGIEGWSIQDCIGHFGRLCDTAFTPRQLHNIPVLNKLETMNHHAKYKRKPLERVLQETFTVSRQPLFGGQHSHRQSSVKTAVTATTEIADQAVLLTNYNRSHDNDYISEYRFERAELPENELNVWEAARATSAAPTYFKSFRSERNKYGYLDGALYHNNPVRVADLERRLIWPETEGSPPDLLLSIGTGCNNAILSEAQRNAGLPRHTRPAIGSRPSSAVVSGPRRMFTRMKKDSWFNMLVKRIENILDTERTWLTFMSECIRGDENDRKRYQRVNPNLGEQPPKLDETKQLPHLRQRMVHVMKEKAFQDQIGEIARRLVASSFYVETPSKPRSTQSFDCYVSGDYLKNVSTLKFKPHFVIEEKDSRAQLQEIPITLTVIEIMMNNASFDLEAVYIPVSSETATVAISLSIISGEALPISGFPRSLMSKKATKVALVPTRQESQKQPKLRHVVRPLSFPDDISSQKSEESDTAFPEIQQLPKEAKLLIWRFLHEKIEALISRNEEVPAKMTLVERACDVDSEEDEDDLGAHCGNGPYGTVLHTACAIGIRWLVEMQIKARVDVTQLDDHGWTPLMVAEVQGHTTCARILSEYMGENGANIQANPLFPSGLIKSEADVPVSVNGEHFTALPALWHYEMNRKRVHVRANHPIPPKATSFYFEIFILNNGPLGILGIGLCRSETNASGIAFRNVTGILYPMIGFGEPEAEVLVNFGARPFTYNIESHRWGREERFVDIESVWSKASRPIPVIAELAS
ncbi:MAG: hypothetical protein Q9166_000224 [cf. Caloplaca sp. 2 TL-2023]